MIFERLLGGVDRGRLFEIAPSRWAGLGIGNGLEQMGPIVEDDIRGDGAEVFEESVSSASGGKGGAPGEDAQLGSRLR